MWPGRNLLHPCAFFALFSFRVVLRRRRKRCRLDGNSRSFRVTMAANGVGRHEGGKGHHEATLLLRWRFTASGSGEFSGLRTIVETLQQPSHLGSIRGALFHNHIRLYRLERNGQLYFAQVVPGSLRKLEPATQEGQNHLDFNRGERLPQTAPWPD
jgi:hypothetical protein